MMRSRAPLSIVAPPLAALALAALAGCSDNAPPSSLKGDPPVVDAGDVASCPDDFHASCPTPAPSYATSITPIVQTHCVICHRVGGQEPTEHGFATYDAIFNDRMAIEDQINDCAMPPSDAGTSLPTTERVVLLTWLACGAPNN